MLRRDRGKGLFALLQLIKVHSVRYSVTTAIMVLMIQKWMRLKEKSSWQSFLSTLNQFSMHLLHKYICIPKEMSPVKTFMLWEIQTD